jgi:hypothetical protein
VIVTLDPKLIDTAFTSATITYQTQAASPQAAVQAFSSLLPALGNPPILQANAFSQNTDFTAEARALVTPV